MGWYIELKEPVSGKTVRFDTAHQMKGGTYTIGGTDEAHLTITYNYSKFYYRDNVFGEKGIRTIYGMSGADSIPLLEKAINALGDDIDSDYWTATEGNAKKPLCQLLAMAKMRPDGIWDGD